MIFEGNTDVSKLDLSSTSISIASRSCSLSSTDLVDVFTSLLHFDLSKINSREGLHLR